MADQRFFPPSAFVSPPAEYAAYERARVVVLPVPYDSTTTARAGARDGPAAIIAASEDIELYDLGLGFEPYRWGIHTLPELAPHSGSAEATIDRIEEVVGELVDGGKFVVTLGGEHTVAVGAVRAHKARNKYLSVLAIDAHADLRDEYLGSKYNHACTIRRIYESAPVTQVGLRSAAAEEVGFMNQAGLEFVSIERYRSIPDAPRVVASLPYTTDVYITIDLDGLDPSVMAAVGTPEPGGLLWDEVVELLAAVALPRKGRIVGFDVTELAPAEGPRACAQLAAKLAYRLIGLALGPPGEK